MRRTPMHLLIRRHTGKRIGLRQMDPLVRASAYEFALNLIGRHEWTQQFTSFIMELIDIPSRVSLMRRIKPLSSGDEKKDPADAIFGYDSDYMPREVFRLMAMPGRKNSGTRKIIEEHLIRTVSANHRKYGTGTAGRRLKTLKDMFKLSDLEIKIVCLFYCQNEMHHFENLCDEHKNGGLLKLAALATGAGMTSAAKALSPDGTLRKTGILINSKHSCLPFCLDSEIQDFLAGLIKKPLIEKFCRKDSGKTHMLDQFNIPADSVETMRTLLAADGPCSILLYGEPGTGKTEFARSIADSIGRQAYFVQYSDSDASGRPPNRRLAIQAAVRAIRPESGIIIVDEADSFLNTRRFMMGSDMTDKGWHNNFMDASCHKIIWIVNDTQFIEESTMRRFSYSLRFRKFSRLERQNIWQNLAGRHPLRRFLSADLLKDMARRYQANAAGISSALSSLKTILPPDKASPEAVKRILSDLLERHLEATGHDPREKLNHLTETYDIGALNTDIEPARIIDSLKTFADFLNRDSSQEKRHVNLLFWGPPGTGKTEFAKYIADQLSMGLLVKRASDLLNPFVGVTEMLIRDTFEEAEREKSILFLDEADSMFINRETAVRSWETSRTNELLSQMENFRGILICCTNLMDHMDKAVARRFAWKIQFKPLTKDGRISLFEKYFMSGRQPLEPGSVMKLAAINGLTAGDFRAVLDKYVFTPKTELNVEQLIEELRNEAAYRNGSGGQLGFSG